MYIMLSANVNAAVKPNIVISKQLDNDVYGLAMMNDELFVTFHLVKHVSVYNSTTLQLKRTIEVPRPVSELCGLALCPYNKLLFVADLHNGFVHRFNLVSGDTSSWETPQGLLGLSVTSKHNILVTCRGWSTEFGEVHEYTLSGSLVRQTSHDNDLWQAVETINDTLLVSRRGPIHGIAELTWDGRVLRCYGNQPGSGPDQMKSPHSLVVTSNGIVLVADMGNKRIQILDSSLETARTLQLPADVTLDQPYALCYDESRGRLCVGEWFGGVIVIDHMILR
jgi:NHL repeat